jgi:hypothetical protein
MARDGEKHNKNIRNDIEGCQETLKTMPNVSGKGKSKPSFKHKNYDQLFL